MLMNMLGTYSEFFSDQLAEHVSKAQRRRARLGLPIGPVPFGYVTSEKGGVPQPNEKEAEAVQEIFQRRASGESTGCIAKWLNHSELRTLKGGLFTPHAIKDILNTRFYSGKIKYLGEEFAGQHEAIISEEIFDRVKARKRKKGVARSVAGPKGLLQGMLSCGNCGKGIQSDRHRLGGPMYRERHSVECVTNNKSIMAHSLDEQVGAVLQAMDLHPVWKTRMTQLVVAEREGLDPKKLEEKRRRLSRAYADGAFTDAEYETKLDEITRLLSLSQTTELPTIEDAAKLFEDIPQLWKEATPEERRKLISPLIERVYVDMDSRLVGAITPVPAFRTLLNNAMAKSESAAMMLLSQDETERLKVWSWWRRGRVELPVQKTTSGIYYRLSRNF